MKDAEDDGGNRFFGKPIFDEIFQKLLLACIDSSHNESRRTTWMRAEAKRLVHELFQVIDTDRSKSIEPAEFTTAVEQADWPQSICGVLFCFTDN